jgi:mycothiol system anti-sigma-R factor
MECRYICKLLCAYLDNELALEKAKVIEKHIESCDSCQQELEFQKMVKSMIQQRFQDIMAPSSLRKRVIFELERAEEYRESGIQALDLIRWGTHIAQFYQSKDDLIEVLAPYMRMGLEQNEMCVWILYSISEEEAREALKSEISGVQKYIDKGQMKVLSYKDWYLSNGCFSCQYTLESNLQHSKEALSCGYSGIRITGDAAWLDDSNWHSFMDYENQVNANIGKYKMLVICSYRESECSKDNIDDVMNTHKYVLSRSKDMWMRIRSIKDQ